MTRSTIASHTSKTDLNSGSWWANRMKSVRRQFAWIRHQRQIRRDINKLMELDDYILVDIGLNRTKVLHAVQYGRTCGEEAPHS